MGRYPPEGLWRRESTTREVCPGNSPDASMIEYMVHRTSRDPSESEAKCFMWNPSTAVAERAEYRLEAERRVSA
eukprot:9308936-Pyramimonas_sp.AAC.1